MEEGVDVLEGWLKIAEKGKTGARATGMMKMRWLDINHKECVF